MNIEQEAKVLTLSQERKLLQQNGLLPNYVTTGGWQLLKSKYLSGPELENPKLRYEAIAMAAAKHIEGKVPVFQGWNNWYDAFMFLIFESGCFSLATPILANMGSDKGLPVSCSGSLVKDSIYDMYEGVKNAAMLSKYGFGTSAYMDIRGRGEPISVGGHALGVVPFFDSFVDMSQKVSQGSQRRGAWAGYIDIDSKDFEELCLYIKQTPEDRNVGFCISDKFIERWKSGDADAQQRFAKAVSLAYGHGKGYLCKNDLANRLLPEYYKKAGLKFYASNLCVTGDQRVPSTKGMLTAYEHYQHGEHLRLFDNDKIISSSPMKLIEKNAKVYTITLENGMSHTITGYHKVKTQHGDKKLLDLKIGDKVSIQTQKGVFGTIHDPDKGFLDGFQLPVFEYYIPNWIWSANAVTQMQFINGVLNSKATVKNKYANKNKVFLVNLNVSNQDFWKNMQLILTNHGIKSEIKIDTTASILHIYCQSRIGNTDDHMIISNVNTYSSIDINSSISSIEYVGEEDVYCVTVDSDEHHWVCNGFITHNCTEILVGIDETMDYTCIISSIVAKHWDKIKNTKIIQLGTIFLDCVASEFIEKAKKLKGLEKAIRFTEKARALGIGVCGYHSYLQSKMISFGSLEASYINNEIFASLEKESLLASQYLAKYLGECELTKGSGVRNASLRAVAPTKSTALIMGGVSEGINPFSQNVYLQKTPAGEVFRVNPELLALLKSKKINTQEHINEIITKAGSVQDVAWLNDEEKLVFRTAFEIDQNVIMRLAANRQKYLDQCQSVNLFFDGKNPEEYISDVHQKFLLSDKLVCRYYINGRRNVGEHSTNKSVPECESCQ